MSSPRPTYTQDQFELTVDWIINNYTYCLEDTSLFAFTAPKPLTIDEQKIKDSRIKAAQDTFRQELISLFQKRAKDEHHPIGIFCDRGLEDKEIQAICNKTKIHFKGSKWDIFMYPDTETVEKWRGQVVAHGGYNANTEYLNKTPPSFSQ